MRLSDIIIEKIKNEGLLSFHDFMEMALYYPDAGYYNSTQNKIGISGDYYTSSNLTSLFGKMIARQLEEMWCVLGEQPFTIVEYGAGMGVLCRDILKYLKDNRKLYDHLTYYIIEKSPAMRSMEKQISDEKVRWIDSIKDIAPFSGCILSNELLDNFAVHQVVMDDELMEVFVDHKTGTGFTEVLQPAPAIIKNYFSELNILLPKDYRTEVNLETTEWIKEVGSALKKGFVLTIDYGYSSTELYHESRHSGTLVCYSKHAINDCPYNNIGMQDITSHVNFSALYHWGLKNGVDCTGYTDQASFLLSLGLNAELIRMLETETNDVQVGYQKIQYLVHNLLVEMGHKFKVLIQQKGLVKTQLKGLNLAAPTNVTSLAVPSQAALLCA